MSNYRLTDEQRSLKEAARRFAENKLRPIALETERKGGAMPREALKLMAENGYVGLDIPTEYGGLGLTSWATPWSWKNSPRSGFLRPMR